MKKKAALGLAGIAAVAVIGGTWAYWSQDLSVVNEFETGKFDSDIVEEFTPPAVGEWLPGVTTEKNVKVTNNGNVNMALVAEVAQSWTGENGEDLEIRFEVADETDSPITRQERVCAAIINWDDVNSKNMPNIAALSSVEQEAENIGITNLVRSLEENEAKDKWVLVDVSEDYSKLIFVYNGIVPAGEETPVLLNSVTLNSNLESGVVNKIYYYEGNEQKVDNIESYQTNYENAQYKMDIHVSTVQATGDAIRDVFAQYEAVDIDGFINANAEDIADAYLEATSSNAN